MKSEYFFSQRLGFTNAQSENIRNIRIDSFIKHSFEADYSKAVPAFLADAPKSIKEYRELKNMSEASKKVFAQQERLHGLKLQHWWIERMYSSEFPLREKMTLFWHNHFVSGVQKVKVVWSLYQQNELFREFAFGNFKELTKRILYDNAMLLYLDNNQNKAKTPNENLSRELLELFTLGVGNYTEQDIKDGAKALAGLNLSDTGGRYYKIWEDDSTKTYLGRTGNWKADDIVDIIFDHPKAANRLSEKLIKWFMTDTPSQNLINEYAAFFKAHHFEIQPFLTKLFTDHRFAESQGSKIKDPLSFMLQSLYAFQVRYIPVTSMFQYLNEQGMVLFNPPNVKGWDGGQYWLSSQKLIQRCSAVGLIASGQSFNKFKPKKINMEDADLQQEEQDAANQTLAFDWNHGAKNNLEVIRDITDRLLFTVDKGMQEDMERLIKYDFDPRSASADAAVTRVAEFAMKAPEFQVY